MKIWSVILIILIGGSVYGQETGEEGFSIPAENAELEKRNSHFATKIALPHADKIGPFDVRRFNKTTKLDDPDIFNRKKEMQLDIMAMAVAAEQERKSNIRSVNMSNQMAQIKSEVKVFGHRYRSAWNRANDDLHFDSKMTPDGGIRNPVMPDMRQPLIRPHYGAYNRGGFYSPYPSHHTSRNGVYFYGR